MPRKRPTSKPVANAARPTHTVGMRAMARSHRSVVRHLSHPSKSLIEAAKDLQMEVDEITPVDLLEYEKEDLPEGPASPLGGEQPSHLESRPESETRRLAAIGRKKVDRSVESRRKARRKLPAT